MHAVCKVPFCHPQYNKKAVFLEFYSVLLIYFWGRVFDNLGGAGEQIKILGHLFTPVVVLTQPHSDLSTGMNLR